MSDPKSPFPAGFERDGKILLLAFDAKAISRKEFRKNFAKMGVDLDEEIEPSKLSLQTPQLERPSLYEQPQQVMALHPQAEQELYFVPDNENLVFDASNGAVYDVNSGEHVGWLKEPEAEPEPEFNLEVVPLEPVEEGPLGPPPEGEEFEDDDEPDEPVDPLVQDQIPPSEEIG